MRLPLARDLPLLEFFGAGRQRACCYEYDLGDRWLHEVALVREVELPESFRRRLLSGARAFPHEDCGGIGGYERSLQFVETGLDPWNDAQGLEDRLGDWSPERFDLEAVKLRFDR